MRQFLSISMAVIGLGLATQVSGPTAFAAGADLETRLETRLAQWSAGRSQLGLSGDAEAEARLGLSLDERQQVQSGLTSLGYDTQGIDGAFGPGTRTALRMWQRDNEFAETGYLTHDQVTIILDQASAEAGGQYGDYGRASPYDQATAEEAALGLSHDDRLSVEQRLAYLGLRPGPEDGFFDADTRYAIRDYQSRRGYAATGYLDRDTVRGIVEETQTTRSQSTGADLLNELFRQLNR